MNTASPPPQPSSQHVFQNNATKSTRFSNPTLGFPETYRQEAGALQRLTPPIRSQRLVLSSLAPTKITEPSSRQPIAEDAYGNPKRGPMLRHERPHGRSSATARKISARASWSCWGSASFEEQSRAGSTADAAGRWRRGGSRVTSSRCSTTRQPITVQTRKYNTNNSSKHQSNGPEMHWVQIHAAQLKPACQPAPLCFKSETCPFRCQCKKFREFLPINVATLPGQPAHLQGQINLDHTFDHAQ
jgi:hypothetical protein